MDYFARISLEVQALLSQVFSVLIDFAIYNFQLIFCCSLTTCDVCRIPRNVSQVVYSTVCTVNKNFTSIDVTCYAIDCYFTSVDCAVYTIDSYCVRTVTSFHDTSCTVDVNSCVTGTQCYSVFQCNCVSFSFCSWIYSFINVDVFATFYFCIRCSFYIVQLFNIYSIVIFYASCYVFDLRIVSVEAISCNELFVVDCQTIVVDSCLTSCYAVQAC